MWTPNQLRLLAAMGVVGAALLVGTIVRVTAVRRASPERRLSRLQSLRTWWILFLIVAVAVVAGRWGIGLLMGVCSGIAVREYIGLAAGSGRPRSIVLFAIIAAVYGTLLFGGSRLFHALIPGGIAFGVAVAVLLRGDPTGYVRVCGSFLWGAIFLIYGLAHTVLLLDLPMTRTGPAGAAGWFVYLVLLTETNDIAQALVGRRFGSHKKHRITPVISPNKTWEGFGGGLLVTMILAVVLAPLLTGLNSRAGWSAAGVVQCIGAGVVIAVSGFFGDINMSAIKRDAGIKDSSRLLPGMGGMIDRIDSLTWSAPAFVLYLHGIAG